MKQNLVVITIISCTMLYKLTSSMENVSQFDATNFDNLVATPLQFASYICLVFFLYKCGQNKHVESLTRGSSNSQSIPLSLLITIFTTSSGVYFNSNDTTLQQKVIGATGLYGAFVCGFKSNSLSMKFLQKK